MDVDVRVVPDGEEFALLSVGGDSHNFAPWGDAVHPQRAGVRDVLLLRCGFAVGHRGLL